MIILLCKLQWFILNRLSKIKTSIEVNISQIREYLKLQSWINNFPFQGDLSETSIYQSNRDASEVARKYLDPIARKNKNSFTVSEAFRPKTAQRKILMDQMTIQSSEMTRETIPIKTIETRLKNSSVQIDDYSTTSQQYEIVLFKNNKFKLGNGYFSRDEILGRQEKIIGVFIDKTTGLQNTVTSLQKGKTAVLTLLDISDMFLNTVGMSKDLYSANTTFDNSRFNPVTSESRNYTSIKEDDAIVRGNVNTDYLKRRSIIQRNSKKANELQ